MTTLPPLSSWDDTAHNLHRTAQLLGAPHGLSTGPLPGWGEIALDFREPRQRDQQAVQAAEAVGRRS